MPAQRTSNPFPYWLRVSLTIFVAVLVPIYWWQYGPANFLWFSDIALISSVYILWRGSSRLASMMAVGVLLPELAWNLDFFLQLLTGSEITGIAAYMFAEDKPLYLRSLSLFHVILPPLLLWMVFQLGYDRRALLYQTLLMAVVLPLSYVFSSRENNINWVFGFGEASATWLPGIYHVLLLMALLPLVIYLPTHWLLARWMPNPAVR